jgi:hypothetical protein
MEVYIALDKVSTSNLLKLLFFNRQNHSISSSYQQKCRNKFTSYRKNWKYTATDLRPILINKYYIKKMHTKSIQLMMGIELADGINIIICTEIYQEPTRLTQVGCQQGKNIVT